MLSVIVAFDVVVVCFVVYCLIVDFGECLVVVINCLLRFLLRCGL